MEDIDGMAHECEETGQDVVVWMFISLIHGSVLQNGIILMCHGRVLLRKLSPWCLPSWLGIRPKGQQQSMSYYYALCFQDEGHCG